MTTTHPIRIGTRGSPLALAQTEETRRRLIDLHPHLGEAGAIEVVVIRTTGDKELDRPLAEIGGKGLFTKEIDEAMLAGRVDIAVNSLKDLPTWLPGGIALACLLPREDPRDALVSRSAESLARLPAGSRVGTTSLRRRAQVLYRRPDLEVVPLRGNVDTRLRKLAEGRADAILLALAGLRRLSLAGAVTAVIEPDEILPAVGQGAIGITCRDDDDRVLELLVPLVHAETRQRVTAERAMLEVLDGSCRTPIAALAVFEDGAIRLDGLVARPDGSQVIRTARRAPAADARAMGADAGRELMRRAGPRFLDSGG